MQILNASMPNLHSKSVIFDIVIHPRTPELSHALANQLLTSLHKIGRTLIQVFPVSTHTSVPSRLKV